MNIAGPNENKIEAVLTNAELDWFCQWGAANEDVEQDDEPEDGTDAEADVWVKEDRQYL